ncbi:helix-turn-helix transcriptional regulator [Pseudahrensia aquimaris]|uniref:Helix-turn-helix transcriptional regulator n=1 Tax=Pseudahrensia aquimaris TaxID=744461 RepID=A0ABW3FES7_9HYPH
MDGLKNLESILGQVVQDASYWPGVCEELCGLFGANGAALVPANPDYRGLWMAVSESMVPVLQEYVAEGWHLNDLRQQMYPFVLTRGYGTDDDFLPNRESRHDLPYYSDFLLPHNIGFTIAIKLVTPNGIWAAALYFDNNHPPISEEEIKLAETVSSSMEKSIVQADYTAHEKIGEFANFFKGSKSELFIFNPHGEQCLNIDTDGVLRKNDNLTNVFSKSITPEISDDLAEICSSDPDLSLSRSFTFNEGEKKLNLLAIQIPPKLRHFHMPFKVCVIVTECGELETRKLESLESRFNLTRSEITTVRMLASGNNINSISELLSLKPSTIRQRLKQIYHKTATRGQVELINFYNGM